jgi:transcriptional regulator with XRE-family HTH domain
MNTVNEIIKAAVRELMESSDISKEDFCTAMEISPEMYEYLLSENSMIGSSFLDDVCSTFGVKASLQFEAA